MKRLALILPLALVMLACSKETTTLVAKTDAGTSGAGGSSGSGTNAATSPPPRKPGKVSEEVNPDPTGGGSSGKQGKTSSSSSSSGGSTSGGGSSSGGSTSSSSSSSSSSTSSSSTSSSGGSGGTGGTCPGAVPATDPVWKAPPPASTSCTAADMAFLSNEMKVPNQTWSAVRQSMQSRNNACASCIFSNEADATWGPVVFFSNGALMNYGACLTRSVGGNQSCAQKAMQNMLCLADVCNQCTNQQAEDACVNASATNPTSCGKYDDVTTCGPNRNALLTACDGLSSIRTMCSAGL